METWRKSGAATLHSMRDIQHCGGLLTDLFGGGLIVCLAVLDLLFDLLVVCHIFILPLTMFAEANNSVSVVSKTSILVCYAHICML